MENSCFLENSITREGIEFMKDAIESFFINSVGIELCVFFCSMIPVIELRGSIPLGWAFELNPFFTFFISVIGNMIPVPFILIFMRAILNWMKKFKRLGKFARWLEAKAEKNKEKIMKKAFWGLFIFVAIPLPGTGAWTGSLVAALFYIPIKKAILAIVCGVFTAGIIMSLVSYLVSLGISIV